ncbi:MAG: O-antigen ligase family protein [Adhaeribacter sp.]
MYAGTAMLLGLSFLNKSGNKNKGWAAFYIFVVAYLFFFVILLASRTSFAALTLTLVGWLILELCRRKKYLSAFLGSAVLLALAAGALTFIPYLNNKVKNFDGLEDRKAMWTACLNIIREHPVFGVGTGDIKARLLIEYKRINFQEGLEEVYNAHNQYFQTTLGLGGLGGVTLLAILLLIWYQGWRKGNFFLISFTLVFGLCCLTESMLSRQSGVVLFSFILGSSLISLEKREIP